MDPLSLAQLKKMESDSDKPIRRTLEADTEFSVLNIIYKIISFLKQSERRPYLLKEIESAIKIKILNEESNKRREIFVQLRQNPKIKITKDLMLVYRTKYQIDDHNALLKLVEHSKKGLRYSDINDCHKNIDQFIKKLETEKKIRVIVNTDTSEKILFYVDPKFSIDLNPEIKAMWVDFDFPYSNQELYEIFKKERIHLVEVYQTSDSDLSKLYDNKKRRKSRFNKYTNKHLPELIKILNNSSNA